MARVMIIDDDGMVCETLQSLMKRAGHACACAADGDEGLKLFATFRPDLVVTDLLMPAKEGLETISSLRALSSRLPIIALSAGGVGRTDFLEVARRLGADLTFKKPFDPAALLDAVTFLLTKNARG